MGGGEGGVWLTPRVRREGTQLRLLCLPHAGAGTAAFYSWRRELPEFVELCPILLPGRERRLGEPCATRLDTLLDRMQIGLAAELEEPYAIFGHSMGALLGYELALRLEAGSGRGPEHLFVSGRIAPQLPMGSRSLHMLPEQAFLHELKVKYGGMPTEMFDNPELREMYLPILRADLELIETHYDRGRPGLRCGITAMAGVEDGSVSREALEGWGEKTTGGFESMWFAGDHFYLSGASRGAALEYLRRRLGEVATRQSGHVSPGRLDAS